MPACRWRFCAKASKIRGISSAAIPGARVFDLELQLTLSHLKRLLQFDAHGDTALAGEFDGVADQIDQHLSEFLLVGMDKTGYVRRDVDQ